MVVCYKIRVNQRGYAYTDRKKHARYYKRYYGIGASVYYVEYPDGRKGHIRARSAEEAINETTGPAAVWDDKGFRYRP